MRSRARQQGVSIDVKAPDEALTADVDRGQVCTVLVNLFLNALDAMPRGGRLDVRAEGSADGAVLEVADTGPGIAPEISSKLFQPFMTTKPHGMGVGLSISRTIIEAHDGQIFAENRAGQGALFRIRLPLAAGAAVAS